MRATARIGTQLMLAATILLPLHARAQQASVARAGVFRRADADTASPGLLARADETPLEPTGLHRLPLWSAPIASAIIPGLGQVRLGKDRFVGYMAAEAFLIFQYAKNNREGNDNTREYRAIARDIARRNFPGTHPDTSWQYYEKVATFLESGLFTESTSGGPTIPESHADTYNGKQWVAARETYGIPLDLVDASRHANYADALAFYESRAIPQAYGWSWRNAQLEKDVFTRTIARSNDAFRRANSDLVALIANHLLSAVDAFASVRLIQAAGGEMRVSASIPIR